MVTKQTQNKGKVKKSRLGNILILIGNILVIIGCMIVGYSLDGTNGIVYGGIIGWGINKCMDCLMGEKYSI